MTDKEFVVSDELTTQPAPERVARAMLQIAALSQWVDDANAHRDPEARTWGRVAKITEEAGEAIEALIAATGQNPRKANTGDWGPVVEECLDVALTALGAVEHLTGNEGASLGLLLSKIERVTMRAFAEPRPQTLERFAAARDQRQHFRPDAGPVS